MAKKHYRLNFADGRTVERKSDRDYTHGWTLTFVNSNGAEHTQTGFSGSRELAEKSASLHSSCTLIRREIVHAMRLT